MNINYLYKQYLLNRILIFDLDNTLICEKEFLYSAYYEISKNTNIKDESALKFLKKNFNDGYRKDLYQRLYSEFPNCNLSLDEFLKILHNHRPKKKIKTLKWFRNFSKLISDSFLRNSYSIFLSTRLIVKRFSLINP